MTTQVAYGGRKFHREVEAHRWWAVVAPGMRPDGYDGPTTLLDRLKTARATGPYGEVFHYENGSCEAMGALISRVTGATVSDLMSELIWSKIGADEDARYILDAAGVETACGGYAATLRDIAKVGRCFAAAALSATARSCRSRWCVDQHRPRGSHRSGAVAASIGEFACHDELPGLLVDPQRPVRLLHGEWNPRPAVVRLPRTRPRRRTFRIADHLTVRGDTTVPGGVHPDRVGGVDGGCLMSRRAPCENVLHNSR